jgi:hypothetical protein
LDGVSCMAPLLRHSTRRALGIVRRANRAGDPLNISAGTAYGRRCVWMWNWRVFDMRGGRCLDDDAAAIWGAAASPAWAPCFVLGALVGRLEAELLLGWTISTGAGLDHFGRRWAGPF